MSDSTTASVTPLASRLLDLADRCVLCGLCSQYCPTYQNTLNEGESPRGRIALIKELIVRPQHWDKQAQDYLDHCLLCRACERHCPSQVPVGQLFDEARTYLRTHSTPMGKRQRRMNITLSLTHPPILKALRAVIVILTRVPGFRRLVQHLAKVSPLLRLLPVLGQRRVIGRIKPPPLSVTGESEYLIFTGCVSSVFDRDTLNATCLLLEHLGMSYQIPVKQTCCGAMHRHNGFTDNARHLASDNIAAFPTTKAQKIITTVTACHAQLKSYASLLDNSDEKIHQFHESVLDITALLHQKRHVLRLRPLNKRVVLHTPCSQHYAGLSSKQIGELLGQIPDITLLPVKEGLCCGAAGSYMLQFPATANSLADQSLSTLLAPQPQIICTTNIGCALHLRAALAKNGQGVEILHPATLLARQIDDING